MKILFYGNDSSGNHGCEAIVHGTQASLVEQDYTVYSANAEEDKYYGLDNAAKLFAAVEPSKRDFKF